jgi:hypothetical protein
MIIITVSHDAKNFVELCIKAVHHYTKGEHLHLVIDNGSQLDALKLLRGFANKKWIQLIERKLSKNASGHALSLDWILKNYYNFGDKFVCLMDSDAHPSSHGWDVELLKRMEGHSAIGCVHFRDDKLLHPSTMIFKHAEYKRIGCPSFRIIKNQDGFMDTGMIVCKEMIKQGLKLLPMSREEMAQFVRHRWCATRRELVTGDKLDDQPTAKYDEETMAFLAHPSAREALQHA